MGWQKDLKVLEPVKTLITEIAKYHGLPPAVIAAVISRESGAGRLLGKWGSPPGTGDRGHGHGLMQVDDRYWPGFLNLDGKGGEEDFWRWCPGNVSFGTWLLWKNYKTLK